MIAPEGYEQMTDDEVLASYQEMGLSDATAKAYLAVLRDPPSDFPID